MIEDHYFYDLATHRYTVDLSLAELVKRWA
jgi:hypothetical protein